MSGELDLRLGTETTNIGGNARGTVLSAGLLAGNGKRGLLLDANAGAYVAEGDLSGRVSVFGIEGNWTLGGSVASAHAGVTGGFYIDTDTSHIVITGFEHFGFGIGEKAGFELRIPIWGNEIFK